MSRTTTEWCCVKWVNHKHLPHFLFVHRCLYMRSAKRVDHEQMANVLGRLAAKKLAHPGERRLPPMACPLAMQDDQQGERSLATIERYAGGRRGYLMGT